MDEAGEVYDVHITDELDSFGTWEYIDFKFTLLHSYYILIWRGDKKKFTGENSRSVAKYVRDDLKEFVDEGKWNGSEWHQKIRQKLVASKNCLVLAWDDMTLPEFFDSWDDFADESYKVSKEKVVEIVKPGSRHEHELSIYEGKMNLDRKNHPILKSYDARKNKFSNYEIPSDDVIKKYVTEMLLENYDEANILLSKHYGIFPAIIDSSNKRELFVEYDFVNHVIFLDVKKISSLDLRIPALLLGFFKHLSCVRDWTFSNDPYQSILKEKHEAEKFTFDTIQKMLEIGIDPR